LLLLRIGLHPSSVCTLCNIRIHLIDEFVLRGSRLSLLLRTHEPRDELLHALRSHLDLPQPTEIHGQLLACNLSKIEWLIWLLSHLIMLELVLLEAIAERVLLQVATHIADVLEGNLWLLECRGDHWGV
jgi:hypothetical protein